MTLQARRLKHRAGAMPTALVADAERVLLTGGIGQQAGTMTGQVQ
jgi:hypothetical protein